MFIALTALFMSTFSGNAGSKDQVFQITSDMLAFIKRHVELDAGPYRKIQQLQSALLDDRGAHIQYRYRATTPPDVTLSEGVADCVAFSWLFVTLARELGLDARFQEITGDGGLRRLAGYRLQTIHLNAVVMVGSRPVEVDFPRFEGMTGVTRTLIGDRKALAHYHNNIGVDMLLENRLQEAGEALLLGSQLAPEFAGCLANLGVYYRRSGEYEKARDVYFKALDLEPRSPVVRTNLAHLLFQQGQTLEAEEMYAQMGKSKFQNPFYHYNLGKQELAEGNLDRAEKRFKRAVKMLPEIAEFHHALTAVSLRRENLNADSSAGLVVAAGGQEGQEP
ncbi:MAG: tetratricopeptide repeat protein [Acidobacteria bacterium]|nr:tetratricopeptide repeat protein [Acidobacteriota bacterium]